MNKRIRKKHMWLGVKLGGANHCASEIARHIGRKILYSGITPKPSYILNVRRYVHRFFYHSSEKEWLKRVVEAHDPSSLWILSTKHLLPDYSSSPIEGRYRPNPPLKDMLEDLVRKAKKEKLLPGVNVHIDDMHSLDNFIRTCEEYSTTSESLSQEEK